MIKVDNVLILVVVEDGLVRSLQRVSGQWVVSLNPCCSGRWSRTIGADITVAPQLVLILVVVEDGLVRVVQLCKIHCYVVLILVVVEDGLVLSDVTLNDKLKEWS